MIFLGVGWVNFSLFLNMENTGVSRKKRVSETILSDFFLVLGNEPRGAVPHSLLLLFFVFETGYWASVDSNLGSSCLNFPSRWDCKLCTTPGWTVMLVAKSLHFCLRLSSLPPFPYLLVSGLCWFHFGKNTTSTLPQVPINTQALRSHPELLN